MQIFDEDTQNEVLGEEEYTEDIREEEREKDAYEADQHYAPNEGLPCY
jgi:hypothetical protein